MSRRTILALALALALPGISAAEPIKFARYPHVSQGKLVFSYHGDIWIANENGANATRLTAHVARDVFPRLSPDGRWVAFSSDRYGNNDVFIIPAAGGEPKQLTFATTPDTVLNWTPDGRGIMVATSRAVSPWRSPIYIVPIDGSLPTPMPIDGGVQGMLKQDGSTLAFNRMGATYWRKGYRGNRTDDIWLQDTKTQKITRLTDTNLRDYKDFTQDVYPMWGRDGQIYFASERSGHFNIWRIAASGGAPQQVTRHSDDGVQFPSMSPDGSTIAYENEFEVWTLKVGQTAPTRVTIDLAFDPKSNLTRTVENQNRPDGFAITPDGDYAAVDTRGEIFIVPTDPEYGEKRQVTSNSWRQRNQEFSPNGKWLAFTSDESKEEEIWVHDRDSGSSRKITTHPSFKVIAGFSPDSTRLAWVGNNRLFVTVVESGATTELGYNLAGGYTVTGWSPDGNWLVYTKRDRDQNADVFLMEVATKAEHNITQNPWNEGQAVITPDGKSVVFISNRVNGINQVFVVPLARLTEDPNDPLAKERIRKAAASTSSRSTSSGQAGQTGEGRGGGPSTGSGQAGAAPALTRPDITRIDRRAVAITSGTNPVLGFFLSTDGRTVYFRSRDDQGPALFSVAIDGRDRQRLVAGAFAGLVPTADRRKVFFTENNELFGMEMTGQRRRTRVTFTVNVRVDQRQEWAQMLDESWRVMKYRFYDEKMHGKDWNALRAKYEPLLKYVGANEDVYDLANEMIGELNASHTGVSGPVSDPQPNEYQTVASTAAGAETREARIRSVASLNAIKYEAWVKHNRDVVDKATNGEIAYVHIQSMNQPSLTKFQNEINQFWNKKGIIVDIRFNGGGNTDQEIIDLLERRPYEYWNSRWGAPEWGRRPRQAIAGPKVMMVNARSGSDSEVTPMAFKQLGLGRVVGNPTAAAVIATGSYALINGGSIRTPGSLVVTYDPERPNNWGINLENFGVAPDVFAENTPEDELAGFDRELKAAIDEVLRMLKEGLYQYKGR